VARTLVLGGVRSGKSRYAEELVAEHAAVTYAATAHRRDGDPDWERRIEVHRRRRPASWLTAECGDDPPLLVGRLVGAAPGTALLVDDVGTWLTGLFDAQGGWDDPARVDPAPFVAAVAACPARLVLVSPEVGWGVLPATRAGRLFADAQGLLNQRLAAVCDEVVLVVAGLATRLK
jgi:adenosyl cobinamide kinase/adenosyl cobinamide phosphate guanylyltransferase